MSKRFILISTALLISNLGFAYEAKTIEAVNVPINQNQNIVYDINHGVRSSLTQRGLDANVAHELSANVLGVDVYQANYMVSNIETGSDLELSHITQYIANKALSQHKVDLSSYSTLVGMAQSQKDLHVNNEVLDRLNTVAKRNTKLL